MQKTIFAAASALLTCATACLAQPAGITPEMIGRSLPLEGAPLAVPGPYMVTSEPAFGSPGHLVFRPTALEAFPKKDSLPVMVWGNGGCAIDSTRYSGLITIASHGFLVSGTLPQQGARQATPDIVKTIGVFNSGVQNAPAAQAQGKGGPTSQPTPDAMPKLHGPVLLINGHEPDFMMPQSAATFDLINNLPVFYGARHNAGHTATVFHPGGGEFANVASNWLDLKSQADVILPPGTIENAFDAVDGSND
jgi:hypothetical protein